MKTAQLNFQQILKNKRAIIVNDDERLNKNYFETIIVHFLKKEPQIKILYFPINAYIKMGFLAENIWKLIQNHLMSENYSKKKLLLLMDGLEHLTNKKFHFRFNESTYFYGIASSFINWDNHNLFTELTPHFQPHFFYNLQDMATNHKWQSFNQFLYHYCLNLYEANNLVKMEQDWNIVIENLISQKIPHLKHKKISVNLLRKIIQEISFSPLGAFRIGIFCEKNDERYESVVLAINYLIDIRFIFEIKFVLSNDVHSRKKQSLYFFNHNFIYFYFSHYCQQPVMVENILMSQIIKDYWQQNNYQNMNSTYQYDKNESLLKIKIGWLEFQIDLNKKNYDQIQFNHDVISKVYQIENFYPSKEPTTPKTFFGSKKMQLTSFKVETNDVNLFDYLQMINL